MFGKMRLNTLKLNFCSKMMYEGCCSNLVFQPAGTLAASAAFNKEVLVLQLSPFTRNVKQKERKNCVWKNASKQVKITASLINGKISFAFFVLFRRASALSEN